MTGVGDSIIYYQNQFVVGILLDLVLPSMKYWYRGFMRIGIPTVVVR